MTDSATSLRGFTFLATDSIEEDRPDHVKFGDVTMCRFDSQKVQAEERQGSAIDIYRERKKEKRRKEKELLEEISKQWGDECSDDPFADNPLLADDDDDDLPRGGRGRSSTLDWNWEPNSNFTDPVPDNDFADEPPMGRSRGRPRNRGQSWDGTDSADLESIASIARTEEKATAAYRVRHIESGFAIVWKLNHVSRERVSTANATCGLPDGCKDSWNWRRRFVHLKDDGDQVELEYISEKFNDQFSAMFSISKTSPNVKIAELPVIEFGKMPESDSVRRWEVEHQHELAVGDMVTHTTTVLDTEPGMPDTLFPITISWHNRESESIQRAVFALVSTESREAWIECLRKHLPQA